MRDAQDLEELDAWPEYEPVQRCPECGDDDRHDRDCSRNYRNRAYGVPERPDPRRENYWLGYRSGRSLAERNEMSEAELWDVLATAVGTTRQRTERYRAFALGELRGYRSARP